MAKTKGQGGESISGYFRQLFEKNPELLDHGKNDVILARWKADHPGQSVNKSILGNMSNIKSVMRKKFGKVKRRRKHGKAVVDGAPKVHKVHSSIAVLERLEGLIDECLSMARNQGSRSLEPSIKYLLAARRAVAWAMGKPT